VGNTKDERRTHVRAKKMELTCDCRDTETNMESRTEKREGRIYGVLRSYRGSCINNNKHPM
jgi:hypothetical protein